MLISFRQQKWGLIKDRRAVMTGKMNSAAPVPAAKRNWRWTRDDVELGALGFPTFLWLSLIHI